MTAIADAFPEVEAEVEKIVSALKPVGSCNVQLRINKKGKPTAFEINARFSSSVAIRAHFGFNEVEATLRSFLFGEEIKALSLRKGVAMRYFNEVYIEREEMDNILVRGESRPFSKIEEHF
ncbi:MAG TPA: hypothetical protein DD435_14990 [Cyanobacteria bacterium UBA8530]|nr:hypothetical protein [Cyanobacteria bacterium UBA8530]